MDCAEHGTMVANIIGAITSMYVGVSPHALFGAYRIAGCDTTCGNMKEIKEAMNSL
jgi:hypothetical protein